MWRGLLLLLCAPALAQTTLVTAKVQDANGGVYSNGSYSINFVGQNTTPGAGPYLMSGSTFQTSQSGTMDAGGNLAVALPDNVNAISPTPSQWQFNICSASGYSGGNSQGKYCFTTLLTITGASQVISSSLSAVAPLLPILNGGCVNAVCASLSGNNVFTGTNNFSANTLTIGTVAGTGTFTGVNTFTNGTAGLSVSTSTGAAGNAAVNVNATNGGGTVVTQCRLIAVETNGNPGELQLQCDNPTPYGIKFCFTSAMNCPFFVGGQGFSGTFQVLNTGAILLGHGVTFSALPGAANGSAIYCGDCANKPDDGVNPGLACAGSGHGAWALVENNRWDCF